MMKLFKAYIILVIFCIPTNCVFAQQKESFKIIELKLPDELQNPNHEFSGLYIAADKLFLLPENRNTDNNMGELFTIKLSDIEHQLKDSLFNLPYQRIIIKNLESVKQIMTSNGNTYEGLEAITIQSNIVYLSVETTTSSTHCYILSATLADSILIIDNKSFKIKNRNLIQVNLFIMPVLNLWK